MHVLLSTYDSRGDVGSSFRSAGDEPRRAAGLAAAQFDTVAGAVQRRDALVATGVTPPGVWR